MPTHVGNHVWIIGASSGIGRATAIELAAQGAILALSARSEDKLNALQAELGEQHLVLPLDVTDAQAVVETAATVRDTFPRLDRVIFMAAIYDPTPFTQLEISAVQQMITINLIGAVNLVHAALPVLRQQGAGQLVLCGSVAGYRGLPNSQPYSATKAALINLAESLRAAERALDIKVINPGFVRTALTDKNDFNMPMIIDAEQAAKIIAKELLTKRFEIHFPKRFTYLMKLLALLPAWAYFGVVSKS